jgi:hypothetical protein
MLSLSFHRRHLRRAALLTASAWVSALVAVVAHACLLQPEGGHSFTSRTANDSTVFEPAAQTAHVAHEHHGSRGAEADGTTDPGQASCVKFCDDESSTVAKTAPHDLPGLLVASRTNWHVVLPATSAVVRVSVERPLAHGPPLVIRFLRLTI